MTSTQEQAAVLIGQGRSYTDAAELVGVQRMTVFRWLKSPEFEARVVEEAVRIREALRAEGIANKQNRIDSYNLVFQGLHQVVAERAVASDMQDVPGGKTGLLVRQVKQIGAGRDAEIVEEFAVDTGLIKSLNDTSKQAAIELQQWTERKTLDGSMNTNSNVTHEYRADSETTAAFLAFLANRLGADDAANRYVVESVDVVDERRAEDSPSD